MPRQFGDRFGPRNIGDVLGGAFSTAGQAFGDVPQQIEERDFEREFLENERTHQRQRQSILDDQARETQLAQLQSLSQAFNIRGAEEERRETLFPFEEEAAGLANQLTQARIGAVGEGGVSAGELRKQTAETERLATVATKKELTPIRYTIPEEALFDAFGVKGKDALDAAKELNQRALATVKADLEANAAEVGPSIRWENLTLQQKRKMIKDQIDEWMAAGDTLGRVPKITSADVGL